MQGFNSFSPAAISVFSRSGVAQWLTCWAHDPKVRGSKPRSLNVLLFDFQGKAGSTLMSSEAKSWPHPDDFPGEKLAAPWGLPGRSPTPVLTGPCAAYFRRSEEIRCIRRGMAASNKSYRRLMLLTCQD